MLSDIEAEQSFTLLALLGFCHRQIKASRAHIPVERSPRKAFPTTVKTLGDHIKAKRVEKGVTQRQLAQMMDIGRALLQRWERDRQAPHPGDWRKLVEILGLEGGFVSSEPTAE